MGKKTKAAPPPPRRIVVRVRTPEEAEAMEAVKAAAARPRTMLESGLRALYGDRKGRAR